MRDRLGLGALTGIALLLAGLVAFSAVVGSLLVTDGEPAGSSPSARKGNDPDCTALLTPENLGPGDFDRYGIGDKLADNQFQTLPLSDYTLCAYPPTEHDWDDERMDDLTRSYMSLTEAETYYLFHTETGELVLWRMEEDRQALAGPQPAPTQVATAELLPIREAPTACIGFDDPIVIDGKIQEHLSVADILGSGQCGATLGEGQICWRCPGAPPEPSSSEAAGTDVLCIDVQAAMAMAGPGDGTEAGAAGIETEACDLVLGGGEVCWHCSSSVEEPEIAAPVGSEAAASPAAEAWDQEVSCRDLVTPESVGIEEYERFGAAELLQNEKFQRYVCEGRPCIVCSADRTIDEVEVLGDEIYYRFLMPSGELEHRRIHWREDLPDHLPVPLISRQEAEAMVEGELTSSSLGILSPTFPQFSKLLRGATAEGEAEWGKATYEHPCWLVHSTVPSSSSNQRLDIHRLDVIDAVTGEWLGRATPH